MLTVGKWIDVRYQITKAGDGTEERLWEGVVWWYQRLASPEDLLRWIKQKIEEGYVVTISEVKELR